MEVTYIDLIGNFYFTDVTNVNKPIKVLGISLPMASITFENSTLF